MAKVQVFFGGTEGSSNALFTGESVDYTVEEDGSLSINNWETAEEQGSATFAPGGWIYVRLSTLK